MFWGAAAYNNGILPYKHSILGEAYTRDGKPASIVNPVKPDTFLASKGILPSLTALPSWETIPPSDVFRVFERGGRVASTQFPEIGLPNSSGALQKLDEMQRHEYPAGFPVRLALKDLKLVREVQTSSGTPMGVLDAVLERFTAASPDIANQDLAAIYELDQPAPASAR